MPTNAFVLKYNYARFTVQKPDLLSLSFCCTVLDKVLSLSLSHTHTHMYIYAHIYMYIIYIINSIGLGI